MFKISAGVRNFIIAAVLAYACFELFDRNLLPGMQRPLPTVWEQGVSLGKRHADEKRPRAEGDLLVDLYRESADYSIFSEKDYQTFSDGYSHGYVKALAE